MAQQHHPLAALHISDQLIKSWVIVGFALTIVLLWVFTEPLPQNLLYHNFADQRSMIGIPHALNVLSNVLFCLAGIWGAGLIVEQAPKLTNIGRIYFVFFLGVFFTGFGSAFYHWSPDNISLVWDRLPMTIAFMAFTAIVVSERYTHHWVPGHSSYC
ncbi:hypothetical protein ACFL17_04980 [Pseudomonadota bacterium]